MRVPFFDLKAQHATIETDLQSALNAVVARADFILGAAVASFEQHFAAYIGTRHCIGLNSGTSALHLALLACGIGPGDEVITTPHTWISTAWAISYVGATPVFADIDPVTWTLSPEQVERAVTPRTRAILPVHLYGQASDLTGLEELARKHKLVLIEDAAQAHGAGWQGRRVGSFGKAGCFSFFPSKNLGAFGEAGAVVTDDDELAARVRRLRDHAQASRHHHVEIGYNLRMEGIQGGVLDVKLRHLDAWNAARARHARRYHDLLAGVAGLELPTMPDPERHVWHLFVALVRGQDREHLRQNMAEKGIATGVHYPTPIPFQPVYAHLNYRRGGFPIAEDVMGHCVSLPMFPDLTDEQIERTAQVLRECMTEGKPTGWKQP